MTATHTSRRAILKVAAMLSTLPAMGVPVFASEPMSAPIWPDLTTVDGRIRAAVNWLGLPPAPLTFDQEDPRGGLLLTDELSAWLKETDLQSHLRWIFDGDATGASVEQQRRNLLQDREVCDLFRDMDETEQAIMLETLHRLTDQTISMEVIQAESIAKMQAHQAAKRRALQ